MKASTFVLSVLLAAVAVGCNKKTQDGGEIKIRETVEVKPGKTQTVAPEITLAKPGSYKFLNSQEQISQHQQSWEAFRDSIDNNYSLTYDITAKSNTVKVTSIVISGAADSVVPNSTYYTMDDIYEKALAADSNCTREILVQVDPAMMLQLDIKCDNPEHSVAFEVTEFKPLSEVELIKFSDAPEQSSQSIQHFVSSNEEPVFLITTQEGVQIFIHSTSMDINSETELSDLVSELNSIDDDQFEASNDTYTNIQLPLIVLKPFLNVLDIVSGTDKTTDSESQSILEFDEKGIRIAELVVETAKDTPSLEEIEYIENEKASYSFVNSTFVMIIKSTDEQNVSYHVGALIDSEGQVALTTNSNDKVEDKTQQTVIN